MPPHILLCGAPRQFPNYEAALVRAGAVVRFPGGETDACDGLLLPGGGDLDPALYGQSPEDCREVDGARDRRELDLCRRFLAAGKPVLGICRGLQVLNVALGGTLRQQVPGHGQTAPGVDGLHPTLARAGGFLGQLYGRRFTVNTAHHQAAGRLGEGLRAEQWTADGTVEAVSHRSLPAYGVQWHPERLGEGGKRWDTVDGGRLMSWFAAQCG